MFAVSKSGKLIRAPDNTFVSPQRAIMFLVHSNAHQHGICGDVSMLPSAGQWNGFALLAVEIALLSSMDRRCYFYTFAMPQVWWASMCFAHAVPGALVGLPAEREVFLGPARPGMGWVSAVDVHASLGPRTSSQALVRA